VFGTIAEICLKVADVLENAESQGELVSVTANQLEALSDKIGEYIDTIEKLEQTAQSAGSSLETTNSLIDKIRSDVRDDFSMVSDKSLELAGLQKAQLRIEDYLDVLDEGQDNVEQTTALLAKLQKKVNKLHDKVLQTKDNEKLDTVLEMLQNNPEEFGTYLSSLVNLESVPVYETENYGSAMSPFYTILAIWVGALILVAVIHTKVHPIEGVKKLRAWQMYFGRYTIFFVIGQVQTLICVLGDLYFLGIQCQNKLLFWLAGAVSSFVFTLLIYSLTFALGNVGEALAVIIMVIQVAGAGGTFPIEVLPTVYQRVYAFLPFTYGMNAMRECVSGMYENAYWIYLQKLLLFAVVSLFIGLILRIPFVRLNERIEKSKEQTDLMV
jgi:putative membrane protein